MNPRIAAHFARQHGLITTRQALDSGLRTEQLRRLVRVGAWVKVRPGVYAEAEVWNALDRWIEQPVIAVRAAELILDIPHWYSHRSAAALHGFSLFGQHRNDVHLTRPDMRGRRSKAGITHHGAKVAELDVTSVHGLPCLGLARTAIDAVREHGLLVGLGACDHALRAGVTRDDLRRVADGMAGWPFSIRVRDAVELADAGAQNPLESAARARLLELGMSAPETQFGLSDGRRTVWCDLRIDRHIVELDGKVKLRLIKDGGYSTDPVETLWREKERQDFVCGFKLGMSRLTHHDVVRRRMAGRQAEVGP